MLAAVLAALTQLAEAFVAAGVAAAKEVVVGVYTGAIRRAPDTAVVADRGDDVRRAADDYTDAYLKG